MAEPSYITKLRYARDDLNRVAMTWTDIQEPDGDEHPLVEYTYDNFGNRKTVKTRSGVSAERVTTYTYDDLNRVTKIEYPSGIVGDEEFGYNDMDKGDDKGD